MKQTEEPSYELTPEQREAAEGIRERGGLAADLADVLIQLDDNASSND